MVEIRVEEPRDAVAVRAVNESAFDTHVEANVVDALRDGPDTVSLVAEEAGEIVGHILFSPVTVGRRGKVVVGMGLAPMAIVPARQRRGIGSALVTRGLETLRERGCPFVVVLGHPDFYPRFGFERASIHGLACQWAGVPDEAFMVTILRPEVMRGVSGVARYRAEFDAAM